MKLTLLPSDGGDCILVESDGIAILADGGMTSSYNAEARAFLGGWKKRTRKSLDLVYVSHVDSDHISGVLQYLEDLVEWRLHKHRVTTDPQHTPPPFPEPPSAKRIWHNAFKALVPDVAEDVGTMLASRANALTSNARSLPDGNPAADPMLGLAAEYRNLANSIPEAVKVSRRIADDQLGIPLNGEFGKKLAMIRGKTPIRLKSNSKLEIRVIGPAKEDVEKLQTFWHKWLQHSDNQSSVGNLLDWLDDNRDALPGLGTSIDDRLGKRSEVTKPNLASLMLLLEEKRAGKPPISVVMTGDGHCDDVLAGLTHHGRISDGAGLHVDVLKIPHHGSKNNLNRNFVRRITADHYVISGVSGKHHNPHVDVLKVLCESRLSANADELSANPEARGRGRPFTIWVNCSTPYLQSRGSSQGTLEQMAKIEHDLNLAAANSNGLMTVNYLTTRPLVVTV
jgi:hypothetical protein